MHNEVINSAMARKFTYRAVGKKVLQNSFPSRDGTRLMTVAGSHCMLRTALLHGSGLTVPQSIT